MTEQPDNQGPTHPPYGGGQGGSQPGGAGQPGGSPSGAPYPGGSQQTYQPEPMNTLQPAVPTGPPQPMAPVQEPPAEVDGMYKEGIGYGLWCLWLFGLAGVHRIYMGKYGSGILYLLTWGLFGIGQFVDLFRMKGLVKDANIREGYLPHPRLARRLQGQSTPAPVTTSQSQSLPPARINVQQQLLKAAQSNGGALTVTQGVVTTGLTFEQVEEILREMVAKGYVDVDNAPNSGVVVYRFPELSGPFN